MNILTHKKLTGFRIFDKGTAAKIHINTHQNNISVFT